ncbi:MAG: hypothetical protein WCI57_05275 [Candidatus Berkelbacteria bacterium]
MHKYNSKNCVLVAIILAIGAILPMTVFAATDVINYCTDKETIARAAHVRELSAPIWKDPKDAFKVVILDSDDINVFNLNQTMFITTGLVQLCQRDDEIVGLAIHEWNNYVITSWERVNTSPDTAYRIKLRNLEGSVDTLKIVKSKDASGIDSDMVAVKLLGMLGLDYKSYGSLLERLRKLPDQDKVTLAKWNPPYTERIKYVQETVDLLVSNENICANTKVLAAKQFSDAINGTPIVKYSFVCIDKKAGLYIFFNSADKAIIEKKKITLPADVTKAIIYVHAGDMPKDCKLFSTLLEIQGLDISDETDEVGVAIELPLAYLSDLNGFKVTDKYFDKRVKEKKIETEFLLSLKGKIADNSVSDFPALRAPKIINPCAPNKSAK